MSSLLFAISSLACWTAIVSQLFAIYWLVRLLSGDSFGKRHALNAYAFWESLALICVVAALALPHFVPGGGEAPVRLPVFWPIMPFSAWAALGCLMIGIAVFAKEMLELGVGKRSRSAPLWVIGAIAFYALFRYLGDPVHLARGYISFTLPEAIWIAAAAVIAVAISALTAKAARLRKYTKTAATQLALLAGSIIFGIPLVWLLATSFKEDHDLSSPNGLTLVPKVDQTVPIYNPEHRTYQTHYMGHPIEGSVLEQHEGTTKFEISHPLVLRGFTIEVPESSLKEVPSRAPVVTGTLNGQSYEGIVIRELDDGRRSVRIQSPPALRNRLVTVNPTDVNPVSKPGLRWQNYSDALEYLPIETNSGLTFVQNTLIIVVFSVIGTILSCSIVAYAFSRMRFPGRDLLFGVLLSTMMLPAAVTLLPTFLIFRTLGWIDTLLPLWVPSFFASAFNVFLLRQFFKGIPAELEDSAKIDGCTYLKTFWSVMLPQIKPALAVIGIWTFMASWNNFMGPLIYINSPEKMPISYAVQLFSSDRQAEPELIMAFGTMSMIPVLLLFFFAQRYFIEGVTLSGLGGK